MLTPSSSSSPPLTTSRPLRDSMRICIFACNGQCGVDQCTTKLTSTIASPYPLFFGFFRLLPPSSLTSCPVCSQSQSRKMSSLSCTVGDPKLDRPPIVVTTRAARVLGKLGKLAALMWTGVNHRTAPTTEATTNHRLPNQRAEDSLPDSTRHNLQSECRVGFGYSVHKN